MNNSRLIIAIDGRSSIDKVSLARDIQTLLTQMGFGKIHIQEDETLGPKQLKGFISDEQVHIVFNQNEELAYYKSFIDRLPRFKDGVPALPGDDAFHPDHPWKAGGLGGYYAGTVRYVEPEYLDGTECEFRFEYEAEWDGGRGTYSYKPISECFSSVEALEEHEKK